MKPRDFFAVAAPILIAFAFFKPVTVQGCSMEPTLHCGDKVILLQPYVLKHHLNFTGMIIVVDRGSYIRDTLGVNVPSRFVIHRCILDNGTHVLTKGDGNPYLDGWTPKKYVYGVMVLRLPYPMASTLSLAIIIAVIAVGWWDWRCGRSSQS